MERRTEPEMPKEYDFSNGVTGKYAERHVTRTNVVPLDADVAAAFPGSKSVNDALRSLLKIAERSVPAPKTRSAHSGPQHRIDGSLGLRDISLNDSPHEIKVQLL